MRIIKISIVFITFFTISFLVYSCAHPEVSTEDKAGKYDIFKTNPEVENLGKHITSKGELRTLMIFAVFKDDSTAKSDAWKYDTAELPAWTQKMINNSKLIDFPDNNLTQYFYEMSEGNLLLYGDIYPTPVVPKFEQSEYKSIMEVNHEILMNLDGEIDFSKYDNWSRGKEKKYVNEPDGKVDLIFIVYRNFKDPLFFNNGWTGAAHLYLEDDIYTDDGVKIARGRLDSGSGIQSRGARHGFNYLKYVLAHELGHFLLGAGHIENITSLALMTGGPVWNASRGMHSWEKEKLGWLRFTDIAKGSNSSVFINDYLSTGQAYRIKLSEKEWFILENHQNVSPNDHARDKGIYIFHVRNADRFAPSIEVECADGKWDFKIDTESKKLIKTVPNPQGRTELSFSRGYNKKRYACYEEVYEDNSAWGDEYDAYDTEYNNLFSPVSNPSSINKENIDLAINVKEKKGSSYLVDLYFTDIYRNTPPSKPQLIGMHYEAGKTFLSWMPNKEPDLEGYIIYYSSSEGRDFLEFETLKSVSPRTERDISSLLGDKMSKISVAVKAFDKEGRKSAYSDFIELSYDYKRKKWDSKRVEQY